MKTKSAGVTLHHASRKDLFRSLGVVQQTSPMSETLVDAMSEMLGISGLTVFCSAQVGNFDATAAERERWRWSADEQRAPVAEADKAEF